MEGWKNLLDDFSESLLMRLSQSVATGAKTHDVETGGGIPAQPLAACPFKVVPNLESVRPKSTLLGHSAFAPGTALLAPEADLRSCVRQVQQIGYG